MNHEKLLTTKEVCSLLRITRKSAEKYVKDGLIPAYRIGKKILFKEQEVFKSLKQIQVHIK